MSSTEKELARKLAWAVITSLDVSDDLKKRVRVWAWRLACKMVAAKRQFGLTNPASPPDNGMAGGGADRVTRRESAPKRGPVRFEPRGENASTASESATDVRGRDGRSTGRARDPQAPRSCGCGSWGCWSGRLRRTASYFYRRRWRWDAQASSSACLDDRRHENGPYDCQRNIQKGR